MREKLLEFLKREGLKPSQLAEILEINPAVISHILAGRNKPSFELLQKILRRFPRINPDWLILDSNQIYRNEEGPETGSDIQPVATAQSPKPKTDNNLFGNLAEPRTDNSPSTGNLQYKVIGETKEQGIIQPPETRTKAAVQRIVIFYDDQTFDCYLPTKR